MCSEVRRGTPSFCQTTRLHANSFHFFGGGQPAEEISIISGRGWGWGRSQWGRNIGRLGASEAETGEGGGGHGRRSEASLQGKRDQQLFSLSWRRARARAQSRLLSRKSRVHIGIWPTFSSEGLAVSSQFHRDKSGLRSSRTSRAERWSSADDLGLFRLCLCKGTRKRARCKRLRGVS